MVILDVLYMYDSEFYEKKPYLCAWNKEVKKLMKKLLRYIIPILFAIFAIVGNLCVSDSENIKNQANALSIENEIHYIDSPTSYLDLNLQHQILGANNVVRTQNTTKRTRNGHRTTLEFDKEGKLVNTKNYKHIQKKSFHHNHRFVKSISLLISLGKLII